MIRHVTGEFAMTFRAFHRLAGLAALAAGLAAFAPAARAAQPLAAFNADPGQVSVSGLSSGGFMAAQLGMGNSATFTKGFGVFAGGPYDCAHDQPFALCMSNNVPPIAEPDAHLKAWSGTLIDDTAALAARRAYFWVGTNDHTVGVNPMAQLEKQVGKYVPAAGIKADTFAGAGHTFPTSFNGTGDSPCSASSSPYISNCKFDGAGAALQWLYGPLNQPASAKKIKGAGTVVAFDQGQFVSSGNGMDKTGYVYVPAACASGAVQCKLHVALHGCAQSYSQIGRKYIDNTGYQPWADANNIIVLFPQTLPDYSLHTTSASGTWNNSQACWDWVGWYGNNFDQKGGVQVAAIVAMVNRITSGFKPTVAAK
jgi:poly(3-hydroxybutyrate) depolymerase